MCKELESRIADLEKEIQKNSIPVDETLEKDMLSILADSGENEVTPHMSILGTTKEIACNSKVWKKIPSPCHPILPVHPCQITSCLSRIAKFWYFSVLELVCNLCVCAAVCDGASPNRLFFQLHAYLAEPGHGDLMTCTTNLFAPTRKMPHI